LWDFFPGPPNLEDREGSSRETVIAGYWRIDVTVLSDRRENLDVELPQSSGINRLL